MLVRYRILGLKWFSSKTCKTLHYLLASNFASKDYHHLGWDFSVCGLFLWTILRYSWVLDIFIFGNLEFHSTMHIYILNYVILSIQICIWRCVSTFKSEKIYYFIDWYPQPSLIYFFSFLLIIYFGIFHNLDLPTILRFF